MIRRSVCLTLALFGLLALNGVAYAQKVKVQLAPNLTAYNVHEVAILGLANTSNDSEADQMGGHLIRALNATGKYHFVTTEQFATDAKRTGVSVEYDRVRNTWLKKRVMEPEIVKKLLTATKCDAVVGLEVSRWEKKKVDPLEEGTSDTSVGVLVRMIAQDGTILWSASETKTVSSEPYLPGFNLRSSANGQAVATGSVPQPPDIRKVAIDMASEITATLPAIKKAAVPAAPVLPKETPPVPVPKETPASSDTSGTPK